MAARWLNQLGVLPSDSPCLSSSGRVYDFALALKVGLPFPFNTQDGVILCNAVNKVQPNAVKTISKDTDRQV